MSFIAKIHATLSIFFYVYTWHDDELYILHPVIGRHPHLDCKIVMGGCECNMLEQTSLSAVNDGRRVMLFAQVLTSDRTEVWDVFIYILQFFYFGRTEDPPDLIFTCDHGCHRFGAIGMSLVIIL